MSGFVLEINFLRSLCQEIAEAEGLQNLDMAAAGEEKGQDPGIVGHLDCDQVVAVGLEGNFVGGELVLDAIGHLGREEKAETGAG